jgi:hypothetical protein
MSWGDILIRSKGQFLGFVQAANVKAAQIRERSLASLLLVAVIGIVSALITVTYLGGGLSPAATPKPAEVSLPVQRPAVTPVAEAPKTVQDDAEALPVTLPLPAPILNTPNVPAAAGLSPSTDLHTAEILFVQRPGVNIRATPAKRASVVRTAAKGMRIEVTRREGEWVQVKDGRVKGWINTEFLAPTQPR